MPRAGGHKWMNQGQDNYEGDLSLMVLYCLVLLFLIKTEILSLYGPYTPFTLGSALIPDFYNLESLISF